jgi:hypothetical protein
MAGMTPPLPEGVSHIGETFQYAIDDLKGYGTKLLLLELQRRGGHPGALATAALLCIKKSEDYNHGQSDPHTIDRTGYFPFGTISYAQMLHTKTERFVSLTRKEMDGSASNFEGLNDTALDIINYAGFFLADPRIKDEDE